MGWRGYFARGWAGSFAAAIGIGADPYGPDPSHTTRHAGPHRAVDVVEDVRGSGKATTHNLFRLTFNP